MEKPCRKEALPPLLWAIIIFKAIKGVALALAPFALVNLRDRNIHKEVHRIYRKVGIDPLSELVTASDQIITMFSRIDLKLLCSALLAYALFTLLEAAGLFLRTPWGRTIVIAETSLIMLFALKDLIVMFSQGKAAFLLLNAFILIYLIVNKQRIINHGSPKVCP